MNADCASHVTVVASKPKPNNAAAIASTKNATAKFNMRLSSGRTRNEPQDFEFHREGYGWNSPEGRRVSRGGDATLHEFLGGPHMLMHWSERARVLDAIFAWLESRGAANGADLKTA